MLKAGGPHPLPATPPHPALPWRVTGSGSRGFSTVLWHPLLPPPQGGRPGPHRRKPTHAQQRAWPAQTPAWGQDVCGLAWVQYWSLSDGEVSSQDGVTEVFSELWALLS